MEIDPSLRVPRESAPRLERLQKEKTEKMTAEAMGERRALAELQHPWTVACVQQPVVLVFLYFVVVQRILQYCSTALRARVPS